MGTLLLILPFSSRAEAASFGDALFTATSASCVTGLVMQDTFTYWTAFGQAVILILIQIGGLGFMTIATLFFLAVGKKIGLRERTVLSESFNTNQIGGIVKLARKIIIGAFLFEAVGAILLAFRFCPQMGFGKGIWFGVFHSVSAFCNAGFDLMGAGGKYSSLTAYSADAYVNIVIMALIIIGGIGFLVWDDIYKNGLHFRRYKLHTKIVLVTTTALVFGGALLFFLLESGATGKNMPFGERVLTALFDSVTARTAGFNTTDAAMQSQPSRLLSIILMFIGGSSGSTAGGVKTTTIVVMGAYAFSYMRKNKSFGLFGRRFDDDALRKASAVFFTNLTLAVTAVFIICGVQDLNVFDVMYEAFSAISTVGASVGITRDLLPVSQFIIIFLMYCGRVGSVSFANALAEKKPIQSAALPVEKITLG